MLPLVVHCFIALHAKQTERTIRLIMRAACPVRALSPHREKEQFGARVRGIGRFKRIFMLCHSCILYKDPDYLYINVRPCVDAFVTPYFCGLFTFVYSLATRMVGSFVIW